MNSAPRYALSIRAPWAYLIAEGFKHFENRDWTPDYPSRKMLSEVGWKPKPPLPFYIHAGGSFTKADYIEALRVVAQVNQFRVSRKQPPIVMPAASELLTGGIIGQAEATFWHDTPPQMPFAFGSGFTMRNAKRLPFRPCKGHLGFFHISSL